MEPIGKDHSGAPIYVAIPPLKEKPKLWQRRKYCPRWLFDRVSTRNRWLRWAVMVRV